MVLMPLIPSVLASSGASFSLEYPPYPLCRAVGTEGTLLRGFCPLTYSGRDSVISDICDVAQLGIYWSGKTFLLVKCISIPLVVLGVIIVATLLQ